MARKSGKKKPSGRRGDYPLSTLVAILIIGVLLGASAVLYYKPAAAPRAVTEKEPIALPGVAKAVANIVAVAGEEGEGVVGTATVELRSGDGRVLVSANPFVEPDTQDSIKTAKAVAEDILGASLERSDIIVSFELGIESNQTQVVGGPSAGSAIAVAIIAAVQGKQLRSGVAFTGTVEPDGTIGPVGAILQKAEAAGVAGMQLMIVPAGQGNMTYYEKDVYKEARGSFVIQRIRYFPKTVSLSEYTSQWNMTTFEAATAAEAAAIAIEGFEPPADAGRVGVTGAATGSYYQKAVQEGCAIYG
jgi:predicted S18 family serine protease